jgi:hypothetical protein
MSDFGLRVNINNIINKTDKSLNSSSLNKEIIGDKKSVENKPSLNLSNKIEFSTKNSKSTDFKTTINFLSNEKNSDSLKVEQKNTIANSVSLDSLNNNVNNKIAEEILKKAIVQ